MALDLTSLANLGLPEILLWLLSFAVVYGILSQVGKGGIPKDRAARAIIGIVVAFLVLFAAPDRLITVLSQMSAGLILVVLAIIVFIAFLEVAHVRSRGKIIQYDQKGNPIWEHEAISLFEKHPTVFAVALLIIAVLIFIGAGGLSLIGISINLTGSTNMTLFFFVVIIIAILAMVLGGGEKEK